MLRVPGWRDGETSGRSGDIGTLMSGTLDPALETAARGLKVGEVSEEIQTPAGLHLLLRHS